MTFQPIWPWWVMVPVLLAAVLILAWTAVRPAPARDSAALCCRRASWSCSCRSPPARRVRRERTRRGHRPERLFCRGYHQQHRRRGLRKREPQAGRRPEGHHVHRRGARGARFAMVTFDSQAVVRMPLTTDASALDTLAGVLEPQVTVYSTGSSVTVPGPS